jgi:L-alanine-DL-glutamate epimerase-like enolase superfamily enzyme
MGKTLTRREALLGYPASAGALLAAAAPATIETHVHLFDPERVPYAPDAPYKPAAYTLEDHVKLVEAAGTPPVIKNSLFQLPQGPGLGLEIDPAHRKEHTPKGEDWG